LALVLSLALALGACQESTSKSKPITPPPISAKGQLDTSWALGGYVVYSSLLLAGNRAHGLAIAVDSQNRLVIGGNMELPPGASGNFDGVVLRLLPSGLPDVGFGVGGVASSTNGAGVDVINSVAFDGPEVLAVGQRCAPCNVMGLWRFYANGNLKTPPVTIDNGTGGGAAFGLDLAVDPTSHNVAIAGGDNVAIGLWYYRSDDTLDHRTGRP